MSTIEEKVAQFQGKLQSIKEQEEELRGELKVFVTDKTICLDDRWNAFIESKLGKTDGYIEDWESLRSYTLGKSKYGRDTVEEDFVHNGEVYSKYQTIYVDDIYERLVEELADAEEVNSGTREKHSWEDSVITDYKNEDNESFGEKALDEFREEVLSKMIYSYNFDW